MYWSIQGLEKLIELSTQQGYIDPIQKQAEERVEASYASLREEIDKIDELAKQLPKDPTGAMTEEDWM